LLERRSGLAEIVAQPWSRRALEWTLGIVRVGVLVEIDDGVAAEIDRIGAVRPGAVVEIRVEHLDAKRFPAAGRAAVHRARPWSDAAERLLDVRNQLVGDRIAVRAEVLRVHGVRI